MNLDISSWFALWRAAATRQEGQTMAEYGVVLALITLAVVAVIGLLGTQISTKFQGVLDALTK
jgi:Flp pilus assembly pilin Flp